MMKKRAIIFIAICGCVAAAWWSTRYLRKPVQPAPKPEALTAPQPQDQPAPQDEPAPQAQPVSQDQPAQPKKPITQERIDAAIKEFMKTKIAWRKLPMRLKVMAQADEFTLRVLMQMAKEEGQLGSYATEALGWARNHPAVMPEVSALLKKKFSDRNIETVCAAVKSYARIGRNKAVPKLTSYIAANYGRPDGHGERVCTAAVQGLGEMGTKQSLDALVGQLARADEPTWLMDYGTAVVVSLVVHDEVSASPSGQARQPQTGSFKAVMDRTPGHTPPPPEAEPVGDAPKKPALHGPYQEITRDALVRYAERLRARLPRVLSPRGKEYVKGKIAEALFAAGMDPEPAP